MLYPKSEPFTGQNYIIVESQDIDKYSDFSTKPIFPKVVEAKSDITKPKYGLDLILDKSKHGQIKDMLEKYAKEKFGVDLDKRKTIKKLEKEIEELENGNG